MKKVFLALMCVAAIALVGCKGTASNPLPGGTNGSSLTPDKIAALDNTTEKCWQLGIGASAGSHSEVTYDYMWCTEREAAQWAYECYQLAKSVAVGVSAEYAYKESSAKTVEECNKLAEEAAKENGEDWDDDFECYQIYYVLGGTELSYTYMWSDEQSVENMIASLHNSTGMDYKYRTVDADDSDSCIAHLTGGAE